LLDANTEMLERHKHTQVSGFDYIHKNQKDKTGFFETF